MLLDNPILTMLGRRGRGAVVQAILDDPGPWSVRGLARAAGVPPGTASRAAKELEALGVIELVRPGRDAQLHWLDAPVARALAALRLPDVRHEAMRAFATAYAHPAPLVHWLAPGDHPGDPAVPTRIAVLADDEEALDAVGPALDVVRAAGWPAPEVTTWDQDALDAHDPVAQAILHGAPLQARRAKTGT